MANLPSFATPTWRLKARYELAKSKLELNTACAFAGPKWKWHLSGIG